MIPKPKFHWINFRELVFQNNFMDKLSRMAIMKTFAKKAKIREIRESFSD